KSEKRGVHAARNGPSEDRKCWQRVELGIHGLNRWTANCLEVSLNTRGVVLYRAGQHAEAVTTLDKSLKAGQGQFDGFDLFFLAMAHHRLGHREEARRCLDRAIEWMGHSGRLTGDQAKELASFRAEAESVLAGPTGELPDEVSVGVGLAGFPLCQYRTGCDSVHAWPTCLIYRGRPLLIELRTDSDARSTRDLRLLRLIVGRFVRVQASGSSGGRNARATRG